MNIRAFACLLLTAGGTSIALAQGCDSAEERLNYVKERLNSSTSDEDLNLILKYLEASTRSCRNSGDLWHYRALVEEKLKKKPLDVAYSQKQAKTYTSLALRENANPFAAVPTGDVPPFVKDKWALVVGIGEFEDPGISKLRFTAKDAKDFAATLTDPNIGRFPPDHVRVLLNKQATLQSIRDEVAWIRSKAQPEDLVILYISSHGSPRTIDKLGVSFIITHDTKLDLLYARSYPMVDLVQQMSRDIAARRVVLLLDACHSGAAVGGGAAGRSLQAEAIPAEGAESVNPSFATIRNAVGRAVMMSSRADETSWESETLDGGKGNGYFTSALIQAMKQKDGLLPLRDIYAAVNSQVSSKVNADLGKPQHPVFQSAQQGGDIILGVAPKQ